MARAHSLRRSRTDSSRASLRARASRAAASRSCTSRKAFSRALSAVSAMARSSAALLRCRSAAAMASSSRPRRCSISAGRLTSAARSNRVSAARARKVSICSRALAMRFCQSSSSARIASSRSWRSLISRSKFSSAASARAWPPRALPGMVLRGVEHGFQLGDRNKLCERRLDLRALRAGLCDSGLGMELGLGQRPELLAFGLGFVLGGGNRLARVIKLSMRFLDDLPDRFECLGAGGDFTTGGGELGLGCI